MSILASTADTISRRLEASVSAAALEARAASRAVLVSVTEAITPTDAVEYFSRGQAAGHHVLLYEQPHMGTALVSVGSAYEIRTGGAHEAGVAITRWSELLAHARIERGDAPPMAGPVLLGGFRFDPHTPATEAWSEYPHGLLVLPEWMLTNKNGRSWLTVNLMVRPHVDEDALLRSFCSELPPARPAAKERLSLSVRNLRPADKWKAAVDRTAVAAQSGRVEKVVLARAVLAQAAAPLQPAVVLERLREAYPRCMVFAVARRDKCFLGATPERLVSMHDGEVNAACLAGSRRRGWDEQEDARLGAELLASGKDLAEHEVVVRMLTRTLREECGEAYAPERPDLVKLPNVQHLYTPVTSCARGGQTVLDLVRALHPTPALAGMPRDDALDLIRVEESLDRGWYGAPVGWMNGRGEGEFHVAIRSGLLEGNRATLYAGCGIVAGSDPDAEYEESRLKLQPLIAALGDVRSWE